MQGTRDPYLHASLVLRALVVLCAFVVLPAVLRFLAADHSLQKNKKRPVFSHLVFTYNTVIFGDDSSSKMAEKNSRPIPASVKSFGWSHPISLLANPLRATSLGKGKGRIDKKKDQNMSQKARRPSIICPSSSAIR